MRLISVTMSNFKCFEDASLIAPQDNGLYLVTGTNHAKPASGANGTGKSSYAEAMCWCLYGKDSAGKKAGFLLRRPTKEEKRKGTAPKSYSVTLVLERDGVNHTITRSWNPNSLERDGKCVTEEEMSNWFGLTFEQFLYTVYFPQAAPAFINLGPADKLKFLSNLFGLDRWVQCSNVCKDRLVGAKAKLAEAQMGKSLYERETTRLENLALQLGESVEGWEATRDERLVDLKAQKKEVSETLLDLIYPQENRELLTEVLREKTDFEVALRGHQRMLQSLGSDLRFSNDQSSRQTQLLLAIQSQAGEECPACFQEVPEDHVELVAQNIRLEIERHHDEQVQIMERSRGYKDKAQDCESRIALLSSHVESLNREIMEADAHMKVENAKLNQIKFFDKQIDKIEGEENPYTQQLLDVLEQLENYESKGQIGEEQIIEAEKEVAQYEFWQKRFPQIRLAILNEVIEEMEVHFNQSFCSMGFDDWTVSISTERQLKSDTIKSEMTVKLVQGDEEIDIDSLSLGEKQRLKVCTNIGLSDLIKARCGIPFDLLIFDEPCAFLAQEGIDSLIGILTSLGETQKVMFAEQRVFDSAKFDGVYNMIKDKQGISTVRYDK